MTASKKKPPATAERPEPSKQEREACAAALERTLARKPPVEVAWDKTEGLSVASLHSDANGHAIRLHDVLGTRSHGSLSASLGMLDHISLKRGEDRGADATNLNAALALVESIGPKDELETALAIQMTGCHFLAVEMLGRARNTDRTDHMQVYGALAVKLQRTFAAQLEALGKHRGGGKQQVEVRHVYVNGNAVIGDGAQAVFGDARGGGGSTENDHRPQTQGIEHLPGAPVPEMRSKDTGRNAVPVADGEGSDALPDARRD